jgi:hypothetical protein
MASFGKIVIQAGIVLVVVGLAFYVLEKSNAFPLGRLPGDIRSHRGNFSFYFPIVTCLLLSLLLTLLFSLFRK